MKEAVKHDHLDDLMAAMRLHHETFGQVCCSVPRARRPCRVLALAGPGTFQGGH